MDDLQKLHFDLCFFDPGMIEEQQDMFIVWYGERALHGRRMFRFCRKSVKKKKDFLSFQKRIYWDDFGYGFSDSWMVAGMDYQERQ